MLLERISLMDVDRWSSNMPVKNSVCQLLLKGGCEKRVLVVCRMMG